VNRRRRGGLASSFLATQRATGVIAASMSLTVACGGHGTGAMGPSATSCLEQVTAVYDEVPVVLRTDGTVWVAADKRVFTEVVPTWGPHPVAEIAASGSGDYGTAVGCAIVGGQVWCFPLGIAVIDSTDLGAGLGPGVTTSSAVRVVTSAGPSPVALEGAVHLAGGTNGSGASFCAVVSDGTVWCWGHNPSGVLGSGDTSDSSYARPVVATAAQGPSGGSGGATGLGEVVEARIGYVSTCARKSDGSVWCWGDNSVGQLGSRTPASSFTPLQVPLSLPATRLAASPGNTHCAILQDTSIACWGWNQYAQAGAPSSNAVVGPTVVATARGGAPLRGVLDMAPDRQMQAMCGNTQASGLVCWGNVFDPEAGALVVTPYPAPPSGVDARVASGVSLGAYGASDGLLVYVNADGFLTFGAGAPPYSVQPPCH
jgi:hypothetical protein